MAETMLPLTAVDRRELAVIVALRQHCLTRLMARRGQPPDGFDERYFFALLYGLSGNQNKSDDAAGDLTHDFSAATYIKTADTCAALAPHFPVECYVVNDCIVEGALRWADRGVELLDAIHAWQALVRPAFIEGTLPTRPQRTRAETPEAWQPKPYQAGHAPGCMCRRCGGQKAPRPAVDIDDWLQRRLTDAGQAVAHGRFGPYRNRS